MKGTGKVTLEDVAGFCAVMDCSVELGCPESGFIRVDGSGLVLNRYTYGRFMLFNETAGLPSPARVVEQATIFRVIRGETVELLSRQDFLEQLERIRRLTAQA